MTMTRNAALGVTSAAATAAFGTLAVAVAKRKTATIDRALRPKLKVRRRKTAREAADPLAALGKWWAYIPLATAASFYLIETAPAKPRRRRRAIAGAESMMLSALGAAVLSQLFDRVLPQPPAPPGHRKKTKPVFPSGHAFGPGSVAWTAAYILHREGRLPMAAALVAAIAYPGVMVSGKLVEEKHWASDALGGLLAAAALSSGCAALYEARRQD